MNRQKVAEELVAVARELVAVGQTPFMDAVAKAWKKYRHFRNEPAMQDVVRKYDLIEAAMAYDDALRDTMRQLGLTASTTASRGRRAGTWALPRTPSDVSKIFAMVKEMEGGSPPNDKADPGQAFYGLLGNDSLFDDFLKAAKPYYKACAKAVKARAKELAKQSRNDFRNPVEYDMVVELADRF